MVRDVDSLDALPDSKISSLDKKYLSAHGIDAIFKEALYEIIIHSPEDPVQYATDVIQYGAEMARIDKNIGMCQYRIGRLGEVFNAIDRLQEGSISHESLEKYVRKFGAHFLSAEEIDQMFKEFKPTGGLDGASVSLTDFLKFFAKVVKRLTNPKFDQLVADML